MEELFLKLVNMSFGAGIMILAVLVFRFLLRKNHRIWCRFLWLLVGIRLLCPISLESAFSLIPSAEPIPQEILTENSFQINTQIPVVDEPINEYLGDHYYEGVTVPSNQGSRVIFLLSCIWVAGITILLLYGVITYFNLKHHLLDSVRFSPEEYAIGCDISYKISNVWQSSYVTSPFILGIIRPRIYLPFSLKEPELGYVLAHEKTHIKHFDHLIKPLGFIILAIYWFNPLCWLAYILLCRDVEFACDERTIRNMSPEEKKAYSTSLFGLSKKGHLITACPVAFGEVGVKERIKAVLHYKKPAFWTILAGVVACIVVAVCFLTNPKKEKSSEDVKIIEENMSDTKNPEADTEEGLKTDVTVLKSAPAMEVVYNDQKISVSSGSYSWYIPDGNGQVQGQEADGIHPLDQSYEKTTISLSPDITLHSIELLFPVMPDDIKVLGYWSADNLKKSWEEWDKQTPYQVTVDFKDMNWMAARDDGDFVYEIMAFWDKEEFQGTAYYSFMTKSSLTAEQSMMQPDLENVTMYFEKYSTTGGDIEIANFSDKELQCGQEYYLIVYHDGKWENLKQTTEGAWDDIAYSLPQGETTILQTDFTYLYGTLESGKYRIVKPVMDWRAPGDYTEYELYCDFTIG